MYINSSDCCGIHLFVYIYYSSQRELHLYHCKVAVGPAAFGVLQEYLKALHLTFTQASEIPSWVFSLRNLHELHLFWPPGK